MIKKLVGKLSIRYVPFILTLFCAFFTTLSGEDTEHKIVYLISGPRSLSTVFLRMIESRGDFIIFHEPTIPIHDAKYFPELTRTWFRHDANKTFEDVKRKLYASQKNTDVFVKDMSFSSHELLLKDEDFLKDPSIYFLFLVRNPHHTTLSFYHRMKDVHPAFSDLIGLQKLFEEYEAIKLVNPNGAKIIFSDQLYQEPRKTMTVLCDHLEIPFSEKAFTWKKHDPSFDGHGEWDEQKTGNIIHEWHGRAIQSEKIEQPTLYDTDEDGLPTFSEVENLEHRQFLYQVYQENLIYYKKLHRAKEDHLLP